MNEIKGHDPFVTGLKKNIWEQLELEKERSQKNFKKPKYDLSVSIAALNAAILEGIDAVVDFAIPLAGRSRLNEPLNSRGLTPLHIGVIFKNQGAVTRLVEAGADLNAADSTKWTPLHMAALGSDAQMIKYLLSRGADPACLTRQGGSYTDVLNLVKSPLNDPQALIGVIWRDEQGAETVLTRGKFQELTRATFIDEHQIPKHRLFEVGSLPEVFPFTDQFRNRYTRHIPVMHILSRVTHDSVGSRLVCSPGLGLFAKNSIESQSFIGDYKGVLTHREIHNPYVLGPIDSLEFRNEIPQINDGFPNTALLHIGDLQGVHDRRVLVATNPIAPGEQFCWHYGKHAVKYGPYAELRPKEVRDFIQQHDIAELGRYLFVRGATGDLDFNQVALAEKFRYILETLSVYFSMIFDGTLNKEKATELAKMISLFDALHTQAKIDAQQLLNTALECIEVREGVRTYSSKAASAYEEYFKRLPSRTGIKTVLIVATNTNQFLLKKIKALGQLSEINASLLEEPFLKVWNHLQTVNDRACISHTD
ncbi:MAG: ankyrin repeat domain-containing protein [Chlamydiales bacterium]